MRLRGLMLMAFLVSACDFESVGTSRPEAAFEGALGRFTIELLYSGAASPRTPYGCAVPVRQDAPLTTDATPEVGMRVAIREIEAETDDQGNAILSNLPLGTHTLTLTAASKNIELELEGLEISTPKTSVRGDYDRDAFVADVFPDGDGDGISDNGKRARFIFTTHDKVIFRHDGAGATETNMSSFPDRDGDFISDLDDLDDDGDDILDADEPDALSCPGFSHSELASPSKHDTLRCTDCHQITDPPSAALGCEDCHSTLGRTWKNTPLNAPVDHFQRACEQCHVANDTWANQPGPNGETHDPFPLLGAHLRTDCFSCHVTGNPKPEKACVACHLSDRPDGHVSANYGDVCETCHASTDWTPTGNLGHHAVDANALKLVFGHSGRPCSACHTSGGFQPLARECESCHPNSAPNGHATRACANCHSSGKWIDPTAPSAGVIHPLTGKHATTTCVACHGTFQTTDFQTPRPASTCTTCHQLPLTHFAVGGASCEGCHSTGAWLPANGGHAGTLPSANFPWAAFVGGASTWFRLPHHGADRCADCHTDTANRGFAFFSCNSTCHAHENESPHGGEFFYLDPNATPTVLGPNNTPWPTAHAGCVKSGCHPNSR